MAYWLAENTAYVYTYAVFNIVFILYNAVHNILNLPTKSEMPLGKQKLKTAVLTLRVTPQVKAAAELAAERDRRSVTNLIEVLILNHCDQLGIRPDMTAKET